MSAPDPKMIVVPSDALDRLLAAAERVGGSYVGVHPVLRECHEAACEVRSALEVQTEPPREPSVYEIERDRFGLHYSGPELAVGDCVRVSPV
jgi:hypothetical protein